MCEGSMAILQTNLVAGFSVLKILILYVIVRAYKPSTMAAITQKTQSVNCGTFEARSKN